MDRGRDKVMSVHVYLSSCSSAWLVALEVWTANKSYIQAFDLTEWASPFDVRAVRPRSAIWCRWLCFCDFPTKYLYA